MSSRIGVIPRYLSATMIAAMFVACFTATYAAAQVSIQPKDEVYAGYSWLHPGGYYDFGLKTQDITQGIDISNVYYLPSAHNLGVLADVSMHWGGSYGGPGDASNYYVLGGLQYKYHTDTFSPFFRVYAGALRQVAPGYPNTPVPSTDQWNAALGAGGGFDYNVWHGENSSLAIRVAQVDYIYSNYHQIIPQTSSQWNSVRLSAGLVFGLGNYYTPTPTAACTAQPTEVTEGEPVTVTATGSNFNPKHSVTYAWTTNGGKLDTSDKQSARIDTTGAAAGSYSANATITDPKVKKGGSATCAANFTVKAKPMNPPQVSCSVNPSTVKSGDPSTITASRDQPGWRADHWLHLRSDRRQDQRHWNHRDVGYVRSPVGSDHCNCDRNRCAQPVGQRHVLGGRGSTASAADVQQDQLYPVPGSEETVARG